MKFSQVIGHQDIKQQLIKAVAENRVSHAQLFLGSEGSGNLAMALAYAQYINCENRTPTDSCGTCPSCSKSQKYIHPDIHYSYPFIFIDKEKKHVSTDWITEWRIFLTENVYGTYSDLIRLMTNDNKQGNINTKEFQDILRKFTLTTFESVYKILIMWLPEYMGNEGNRLLKIIEEPTNNTLFIFVAQDQDKIINTILSRVQIVKFTRLRNEDISEALVNMYDIAPEQAKQIALVSDGNMNEAIHMASMNDDENTVILQEWLECCYKQNVKNVFVWNENFVKRGREQQKNFFRYCLHFYRELLLLKLGIPSLSKLTDIEFLTAKSLIPMLNESRIENSIDILNSAIFFVERNANAKIVMTYISVTMMKQFNRNAEIQKPFFVNWDI